MVKKTCDKCGRRVERNNDLALVRIDPIEHYCRECTKKEGISIHPLHGVAMNLV